MEKTIIIYLNDDENIETALKAITKLISQGFTSGLNPTWEMIVKEKNDTTNKN